MSRITTALVAASLLFTGCVLRQGEVVDPARELEIVDDATLAALSRDATDDPLSFRHIVEVLAADRVTPAAFIDGWLHALGPRSEQTVRAAWHADGTELDLGTAPFRLISVANRMDLAGKPGIAAAGEGRLVFALTDGPADDPSSAGQPITVIFEFALPDTRSTAQWAAQWHSLGVVPLTSVAYRSALTGLTASFVTSGGLSQVRWNELAYGMHELVLGDAGVLVTRRLRNTPDRELDGDAALVSFVRANADSIRADAYLLPSALGAMTTTPSTATWQLPGVPDDVREAFRLGTCGGCHANQGLDGGFHVSPLRHDQSKISPMLVADLERRAALLRASLASP